MLEPRTIARVLAVSGERPILIALSGGGDSTALLHLLTEELGAARLRAVVVDHALRDGSAADALRAAAFAAALGVHASIARLSWEQGPGRAQQAARQARYAALCAAARSADAQVIVTGHSRDDQAETVLLRAEHGSGWRGLAGMKVFGPAPLWPEGRGLWLARPLLSRRRTELRDHLGKRSAEWIEDPANANEAYARVRARAKLAALESEGFDPMRLAALAERLAPRVEALDAAAAALIAEAVSFEADEIIIRRAAWCGGEAVRQRALAVLLAAVGGAERVPGDDQVAALESQFEEPTFKGATLSGAVVTAPKGGWRLARDRGALAGRADGARSPAPLLLTASLETVWDRRLALVVDEPNWSVTVENGAPLLAHGDQRRTIAAARWLLADRVAHLLGLDASRRAWPGRQD